MIIRRPLAVIFLAFVLGIGFNYIFSPPKLMYFVVFPIFMIGLCVVVIFGKSKGFIILIISILVFNLGGFYCSHQLSKTDSLEKYAGNQISYSGRVLKYQSKEDSFHKLTIKNGKHKYLIHVQGKGINPKQLIGATLEFTGDVEKPSPRKNPGTFDYNLYLKTINIRSIINCDIENVVIHPPDIKDGFFNVFYNSLASIKYDFLNEIKEYISPRSHGLLTGMLFGSKDGMDEYTYETFQKNGIAHILSVSGIHVGIVYAFVYMILGRKVNIFSALTIFMFLFMYAFLSEFSPSVTRAVLMITIHIVAKLIHKPFDLLTGTSLAGYFMLIKNPLMLFNAGFQLSFLAVILLAFMTPLLRRYVGKKKIMGVYKERYVDEDKKSFLPDESGIKRKAVESLIPLAALQLGMAPFSIFIFNHFSVAGIFLNIPIIFIAGFIIPMGICLIPVSFINVGFVRELPLMLSGKILDIILSIMIKINDVIFAFKFSSLQIVSPAPWVLIGFYGLLFFFASETFRILKNRSMNKIILAVGIFIIVISLFCSFTSVCSRDKSQIVFVDVGQGDCIHVRTPSGKNILIDGGGSHDYNVGKKILLPYLLKNGVAKIDYAFVTHLHTDHFQGIKELSNYMKIDNVITYDGNRVKPEEITSGSGINAKDIIFAGKNDRLNIDDDVYMDILYPSKDSDDKYKKALESEEDENKNSLFMKLNYENTSILITGDLSEVGERMIIDNLPSPTNSLKSTVLKVGHHGSKYSTSQEFLDFVDPEVAVIQVSEKNTYGHPAPQVIEKLKNKDIMIYRNDLDGAVMVNFVNGKAKFTKMLNGDN